MGLDLWFRQEEILRAVAAHRRVAVRSGHKIGKSTSAVILALWWVCTRPRACVIMTSASGRQVRSILWKELRRVYLACKYPLGGDLHKVPDAGLQFSDGREVIGFSTDDKERMAGFSGPNNLYILDEASGIDPEIFEALEGNRAGGDPRLVMFSNPTQVVGEFYDAFHDKRHLYHCIRVSSRETPNATGIGKRIPGLAEADWVKEKDDEWKDSPLLDVRVEGDFPKGGTNCVVALGLVEIAIENGRGLRPGVDEDGNPTEPTYQLRPADDDDVLNVGVDVAREGDDESAVAPRRGNQAFPLETFHGLDGPGLAGKVTEAIAKVRRPGERVRVKVDVIGIGASCYDQLAGLAATDEYDWLEVIPVNVGEAATIESSDGDPGYCNLRAQIWFAIVAWFKGGGVLPEDSKLAAELCAPTYSFDLKNRRQVEKKRETKKRLKRSPDRADALLLSVFNPPPSAPPPQKPPAIRTSDFESTPIG